MNALTLPTFDQPVQHVAKFTPDILRVIQHYLRAGWLVYDLFGGVGGLHSLAAATGAKTICGEIESRVIANARGTRSIAANAKHLPFADATFDAICTSPTYGNRMADKTHGAPSSGKLYRVDTSKFKWKRNTYTTAFGFQLHRDNSGQMQWGDLYRELHRAAWHEALRVLKPKGFLILNISDHIRKYQRVYVSKWHLDTLRALGFHLIECVTVKTPRLKFGKNSELRTPVEYIFVFQKS